MTQAWNGWLHGTCHLYGNWLRGDPRGWRSRNHRRHVEGDYRNPPSEGLHDRLYERSKRLMKRSAVRLSTDVRVIALDAFVEKRLEKECRVRVAALDDRHLHTLFRPVDDRPKHWLGLAKKNVAWVLREYDEAFDGGVWARGSRCEPIADYEHYRRTVDYIERHAERGAALWIHPRFRNVNEQQCGE